MGAPRKGCLRPTSHLEYSTWGSCTRRPQQNRFILYTLYFIFTSVFSNRSLYMYCHNNVSPFSLVVLITSYWVRSSTGSGKIVFIDLTWCRRYSARRRTRSRWWCSPPPSARMSAPSARSSCRSVYVHLSSNIIFQVVFRIRDILERIRIRIRGSVPMTKGLGSLFSSVTFQRPTKNIFFPTFFLITFWRYIFIICQR